jgi:dephospho-CoA kinase
MKIIGLTGSIGMGKSETANMFRKASIPVFDSDAVVHLLMGPNGAAAEEVEDEFPGVKSDNQIDRKKLGGLVFDDTSALKKLENILHPMVNKLREEFIVDHRNNDIVLFDIPLLFEKKHQDGLDYIVVASAPYEVQRERVLARPGMDVKRFSDILAKQMPDQEKRDKADFIVQTEQGFEYASKQVQKIINQVRQDINA